MVAVTAFVCVMSAQVLNLAAVVVLAWLHRAEPALNPAHRFLSEYARTSSSRAMQAVFVFAGTATWLLGGAAALRDALPVGGLLAAAGAGFLVQAKFRTDLIDSEAPPTLEGRVHDLVSASTFVLLVTALLSAGLGLSGSAHAVFGWPAVDLSAGVASAVLFGVTILLWFRVGRWFGLTQRALVGILMFWSFSVGWRALAW